MQKILTALLLLLIAVSAGVAATHRTPGAVNFASTDPMVDLDNSLAFYGAQPTHDGSLWYMITATNDSVRPVTRILLAGQPAGASLRFFPRRARPSIRQIASADAEVTIEPARAYGRHAFRVVVPPASSAALAVRMADADARPSVEAWMEPALVAHERQLAIFFAAVAGLMAAALAIAAGLAFMTGHAAPRWAAITIAVIFLAMLAETGVFDAGWFTVVGGPYGFSVMIVGLCLAAGLRLANIVVPVWELWPDAERWLKWALIAIVAVSVLAFIGVPGAMLLTECAVVAGSGAITAYLVHCGRLGNAPARVLAPSASVFSLVATAAAVAALGGFRDNPSAPAIVGGFAAAGTVLLALAIAAGEGIAVLRVLGSPKTAPAVGHDDTSPPRTEDVAALQAIAASHQGVFELDFRQDVVRLSAEAAALIGLRAGAQNLAHAAWVGRIHPGDRETYQHAMKDYRGHVGLAFRMELRVRSESKRYPWLELRATMLGDGARVDRCLGLVSDITSRKEDDEPVRPAPDAASGSAESAALERDLGRALEADEFEVFYQPIVELDRGSVAGFEALLRWRHPVRGLTGPDEFIAHCEETGLIVSIGRHVLERAARDLAQWQKYFPLEPALFTSVNLSRRQLHDGGLKDFLGDLLLRNGLIAGSLKIEITESAAGAHGGAGAMLEDIRNLGVGLAIDDFGTGLSALSELKDLPFDTIKIDRSFLAAKTDEASDSAVILAAILKLAQDLGRLVVAEGVESERDADWLRARGCHFAQGFYFSVPLSGEDVLKFIAQHYRSEPSGASGMH
ncbi:MAG: EAL domain-containing protein [Rhizomicrobium sp.]